MLALLAAVLLSTPYVPVTCQTGYVATYRGGRVACVNSISQATTSGVAASATSLACSTACVQDAEIQSVALSKATGWPNCSASLGQVLTSANAAPTCATSVKATDLACSGCVASGEVESIELRQVSDTAAGEWYEFHDSKAIELGTAGAYYQWTGGGRGVCENMVCSDAGLTVISDGVYRVTASVTASVSANAQVIHVGIAYGGSVEARCVAGAAFPVSAQETAVSVTCLLGLTRDQEITLRVANITSAGKTITFHHVNLNASRVY